MLSTIGNDFPLFFDRASGFTRDWDPDCKGEAFQGGCEIAGDLADCYFGLLTADWRPFWYYGRLTRRVSDLEFCRPELKPLAAFYDCLLEADSDIWFWRAAGGCGDGYRLEVLRVIGDMPHSTETGDEDPRKLAQDVVREVAKRDPCWDFHSTECCTFIATDPVVRCIQTHAGSFTIGDSVRIGPYYNLAKQIESKTRTCDQE